MSGTLYNQTEAEQEAQKRADLTGRPQRIYGNGDAWAVQDAEDGFPLAASFKTFLPTTRVVGTIDLTPTWVEVVNMAEGFSENRVATRGIFGELRKIAKAADDRVAAAKNAAPVLTFEERVDRVARVMWEQSLAEVYNADFWQALARPLVRAAYPEGAE